MPGVAVGNQVIELDGGHDSRVLRGPHREELNKLEGVQASVNYATEKAHVVVPARLGADELISTVQAGYDAALPTPTRRPDRALRSRRLVVSASPSR